MKITVYTVSDCQFSKAEKEYLQSHNLPYEEKNLEQNREWLTEMLAVSNNFAGTPVTKIEKDDGQIVVLKGFTQEEFDQVFGFKKEESVTQASADISVASPVNEPSSPSQPQNPQPSLTQPSPTQLTTPKPQTQPHPISQPPTPTPTPPTSQPTQPTTPPPPAPTQEVNPPPTNNPPSSYDPLSSVLSDLEQKANPNQPPPPPPSANIPNIPNFNE
jgi:glutaredoxin